jgi:hypothetical protein
MAASGRETGGERRTKVGTMRSEATATPAPAGRDAEATDAATDMATPGKVEEIGGPRGPEPTRYGDWEKGGRCSDF